MTSRHINYTSLPIYHYPHLIDYSMPIPPSILYEEQYHLEKMMNGSSNKIKPVNHLASLAQFCNNYCKEFNTILTSNNLNRNLLLEPTLLPNIQSNFSIENKFASEDKILNNKKIKNDYDENYNETKSSNKSNSVIKKKLKSKKKKKKKLKINGNNSEMNKETKKTLAHKADENKELISNNSISCPKNFYDQNQHHASNKILPNISSNRSMPYNKKPSKSDDSSLPYLNNRKISPSLTANNQNVSKNHNIKSDHENQFNTSNNNFICNWLVNNNTKCKSAFRSNDDFNDHIKFHTTNELVSGLSLYYQAKSLLNQQHQNATKQQQQYASNNSPGPNFFFPPIF
jgi:hypothetical protein